MQVMGLTGTEADVVPAVAQALPPLRKGGKRKDVPSIATAVQMVLCKSNEGLMIPDILR